MRQIRMIVAKSWCGNVLRTVWLDPDDTEAENKIIMEMREDDNVKFIYDNVIDTIMRRILK